MLGLQVKNTAWRVDLVLVEKRERVEEKIVGLGHYYLKVGGAGLDDGQTLCHIDGAADLLALVV